jgi:drug/metabolite transporter (DMT)-like permease
MAAFALPTPTAHEIRRGIAYICAAVLLFSCINALVKWLTQDFPVTQIVFFRCVFALVPCSYLVMTHGGLDALRTRRIQWHATRTALQFISLVCAFTAFSMMPLADAVAISFSSPLFMTALSVPLLGERVGIHRWGAVVVGFLGVLIMVRPGPGVFESGALFILINAFLGAVLSIAIRRMSATESSTTITAYQIMFSAVLSFLLLPLGWRAPDLTEFFMLAAVGLGSGIGQFWWTQAFRLAPAAVAAPFQYTAMIWAMVLGFLIWSDLPGPALLAGAGIVVASGLYILYRETVRRAQTTPVEGQD